MALTLVSTKHEQPPSLVYFEGKSRSGKGTCATHQRNHLESLGRSVLSIDQGHKFRAMARVALESGAPMDDTQSLDSFLRLPDTQNLVLERIADVAEMSEEERDDYLYIPEVSDASGKIGATPSSHKVAVKLMQKQVEDAASDGVDVVLIDGRAIEAYARQYETEGIARFVMGWYFNCDPIVAARRSVGLFEDVEDMAPDDQERLLSEAINISSRNMSDMQRTTDPVREPRGAYHLDLSDYSEPRDELTPYGRAYKILYRNGLAIVDTSYTESIDEMTTPVTQLSMFGHMLRGSLDYSDAHAEIQAAA